MKNIIKLIVITALTILAVNAFADDKNVNNEAIQKEINEIKQRLAELENIKETNESKEPAELGRITDKITLNGIIAGAYQYESAKDRPGAKDFGRGAVPIQLELSIKPAKNDLVFMKFGFSAGNGLNTDDHSFALAPWAASLEDDVRDINGRNRDYLLAAWYKHTFVLNDSHTIGITGGIIDATDYLDDNKYANDEYTQFMNGALVNGPNTFLPSYDIGGAMEWEMGKLAVKGVIMQIGENDEGKSYHFYGAQVGYTIDTPLGEGTYRVMFDATSDKFSDTDGRHEEALKGCIISFDQELGDIFGAWIRFGWSDDNAIIDFQDLYSGGIDIKGKLWGREQDNAGIGCAYLKGGNHEIENSQVAEAYVRIGLNEIFSTTFDLQYLKDNHKNSTDDVKGWVSSIRMTAEF
ncbi:MAG: carbohydrate porin [Desulfobacterium sp.]|nr:carbohydrate porin [Desulfobacterium sp.]MBU3949993.1 carbohydrate porin [Pseudomonadota bacterium]MBU4037916.1 carbohydrate porin [Pseudomonadota bacterium]